MTQATELSSALGPLFESAPDAMVVVGSDGRYAAVNAAAESLFQLARDEIVGREVGAFSNDPAHARGNWEATLLRGEFAGDSRIRAPDGSVHLVQFTARANVLPGLTLAILRDVTAEREAQAALVAANERLESALDREHEFLDTLPALVAVLDAEGRIHTVNTAWRESQQPGGLPSVAEGDHYLDALRRCAVRGDSHATNVVRDLEDLLAGRRDRLEHASNCGPADEIETTSYLTIAKRVGDASARGDVVILHVDISAEIAANRRAERARGRYRTAVAGILDAFFLLKAVRDDAGAIEDFEFEDINDRGCELVSTPREEMLGARLCELFPINREERFIGTYRQVVETGETVEQTFPIDTAGRPSSWLRHQVVRAGDGVAISTRDVTESVEHARRLERLAQIVATQRDGIASSDLSGRILTWNAGAERLLGVPAAEAIGSIVFDIPALAPLRRLLVKSLIEARTGAHVHEPRVPYSQPDGHELTIGVMASALVDDENQPVGVSAIIYDATREAELEHQLLQRSKLEAVGELAGGMAHDFNNFLTVIAGYSALLESRCGDRPDDARLVEQIRLAGERAAQLTRQLLTFARRQPLSPQTLSLTAALRELGTLLRPLVTESVRLEFDVSDDSPCWTRVDRTQLDQSIMNLVTNANDAVGLAGTIRLAARSATAEDIRDLPAGAGAPPSGGYHIVEVEDDGTGMSSETLERIFEPFFTTKSEGRGTGLGLATTYGIVRQSGGEIVVDSELGQGTRFRLFLPAAEAPEQEESERNPDSVTASSRARILVAEDNPAVRMLVRESLATAGHHVDVAADGAEAIAMLEGATESWDLLISDAVMPGNNGREVVEAARRLCPGIASIMISGYTADVLDGHENVTDAFLRKPFRPSDLIAVVERVLSR